MKMPFFSGRAGLAAALLAVALAADGERPRAAGAPPRGAEPQAPPAADGAAIRQWQTLVGEWRGVGQVRRGSTQGAWQEAGQWMWAHARGEPSVLRFESENGKYVRRARLQASPVGRDGGQENPGGLELVVERTAEKGGADVQSTRLQSTRHTTRFAGKSLDGRLVLERVADPNASDPDASDPDASDPDASDAAEAQPEGLADLPDRFTFRTVANGDRLLVLLERRSAVSGRWQRVAELGYTRVGSQFGKGGGEVECVVTGGKGTIPVSYQGKTYYVCCTGCRDYFQENPEKVLAEWRKKQSADQGENREK